MTDGVDCALQTNAYYTTGLIMEWQDVWMGTNGLTLPTGCTRGVIRMCSGNFWQHTPDNEAGLRLNGTLEAINLEYDDDWSLNYY